MNVVQATAAAAATTTTSTSSTTRFRKTSGNEVNFTRVLQTDVASFKV